MNNVVNCREPQPQGAWTGSAVSSSTVTRALDFVHGAMCLNLRERVTRYSPEAWDTGTDLLDSDDAEAQVLGLEQLLRALATTPNPGRALAHQMLGELNLAHSS